jgi:rod shape determining protein RodA
MPSDFSRHLPDHAGPMGVRKRSITQKLKVDLVLIMMLMILAASGLVVLYSGSGESLVLVKKQLANLGIGFLAMICVAQLHPRWLQLAAPWAYSVGILCLVGVLLFGVGAKGAQRWLEIPGLFRFQPSEIMKLVVPLMIAWYLADKPLPPKWKDLFVALVLLSIPLVLILKQPDLGTSLLIGASGAFVLIFAGLRWRVMLAAAALAIPGAALMWTFVMKEYQKQRVLTFLNPELDPLGSGWNIIQSKTAIGSGGVEGKGWLMGTQAHLKFLPESHTDFIIAVHAEEFGLLGVCLLLFLYMLIVTRGLWLAAKSRDKFARLVAGSLMMTFFIYVFVNVGMVSGLLPVVGVPLPLVSYGGTSIVTLMAAFGVVMAAYTHRLR